MWSDLSSTEMSSACGMTQFPSYIVQSGYYNRYCARSMLKILHIKEKIFVMNLHSCEAPYSII